MARWTLLLPMLVPVSFLGACASPDLVGQRVGRSLYDASVNTGHALAVAGDRTGQAIQHAGANLRAAVNPAPPYASPPATVPDGYAAPGPVTAEPLGPGPSDYDPYRDGPRDTPANPSAGY